LPEAHLDSILWDVHAELADCSCLSASSICPVPPKNPCVCAVLAMYNHAPKASTPRADKHILDRIGILAIPLEAGRTPSFLLSILCGICIACAGAVAAAVTDRAPDSTAG